MQTNDVNAPVRGMVTAVFARSGDAVKAGDLLMTIITTKMGHVIKAPRNGTIKLVLHRAGEIVDRRARLITYSTASM